MRKPGLGALGATLSARMLGGRRRLDFKRNLSWRRQGDAHRDAGRWKEAAEAYASHLKLYPADKAIQIQYGHMLKEAGDFEQAIAAYERSEELDPHDEDRDIHLFHLRKRIGELQPVASLDADDTTLEMRSASVRPGTVTHGWEANDAVLLANRLRRASILHSLVI